MRSSSKKAKVNRKPLFKNCIKVEASHNYNDGSISHVVLWDPLGNNGLSDSRNDIASNQACVNSALKEPFKSKTYKGLPSEDSNEAPAVSVPKASQGCCFQEVSAKVDSDKQLIVRRKKPHKRIRRSVEDGASQFTQNDILDDKLLWVSALVKGNDALDTTRCSELKPLVNGHMSNKEMVVDMCLKTSTPLRIPDKISENSSIFSSLNHKEKLLKDIPVKVSSFGESFMDMMDDDDSKLASLDVSDLISSHDSASSNSTSNETRTGSNKEPVQDIQQGPKEPLQDFSHAHHDSCKLKDEIELSSDTFPQEEKNEELFYGLPLKVGSLIKKYKGIQKLYDWQNDCLNLPGLQQRKNLIYSLPTSGGKTLVAEILIMKELLCHEKDAMLILPFVSIVQEKVRDMSLFAVDLEFLVEEYASSKGKFPPRKRRKKKSLYVATIEKANGLVNSLIAENRLSEIGLVVVDELHMLGEGGHRGATLEMCLAKILFCSNSTQIIGMSATLNNIEDLQYFLNAEKYINDFRPVELKEFFKIEDEIFEIKNDKIGRNDEIPFKRSRKIKHQTNDRKIIMNDPDHLCLLAQEVIPKYSCLIFCPTKKNCQNVAELLTGDLSRDLKKIKVKEKHGLLRALKSNADGLCPILRRVIPYGIAYHHGGLTMDERKLIEEAYSQGTLCLLTCTSTLAAGVNLPAKRVILRSPYVGINVMSRNQYKQMIGRAGRAGIDTSGESILILNKKDKDKVMDLISAPLESCHSSLLHDDGQGLRSLVLSLIGLKVCNSLDEVKQFISKTLLAVQNDSHGNTTLLERMQENIDALVRLNLVKKWESPVNETTITRVETTGLGQATFKGCVDVDRSPFIYDELKRAQENLVLSNDLHLLYLVTTPDMIENVQPSWMTYMKQFSRLNSVEQKASEFIGVTEAFLSRKVAGYGLKKNENEMTAVKRFYLTLMLYQIIQEHSLWDVANTFDIPRGFVQTLFSSSSSFASCLVHFTKELPEFHNLKLLLETIVDKLAYTAVLELVPLMQIPGVKKARAKQLYKSGYRNLQTVAKSDPNNLVKDIEHLSRNQAQILVSSAKMLLLEKAEALQEEAADLMEM